MDLIQIIVLAIVQGLTEFLPVSSSAHLILFPHLVGWDDQGLAFDVAVHLGTLAAVVWYFRLEVFGMTRDWFASLARRERVGDSRLAWAVILGTIPVGIAGLLFKDFIEVQLRSPLVIAWATIGFGLLLWWSDVVSRRIATARRAQPELEGHLVDRLRPGASADSRHLALGRDDDRRAVAGPVALRRSTLFLSAIDPGDRACQRAEHTRPGGRRGSG